jgi:PIN domain nuclease of toxin-antitoxin system
MLPIKRTHLDRLRSLPVIAKHTDPFDRLLIAQALHEYMILVGNDRKFPAYLLAQAPLGRLTGT